MSGDRSRSSGAESFQTRPFLKVRKAYLHALEAGRRKDIIHGLVEIDVTDARRQLRQVSDAGRHLSFTAFLMYAVARAVAEDLILHAYRWRNQLILFDDVDVNTQIEVEAEGQKIVKSMIIRAANRKSVAEISEELDRGRSIDPTADPAAERRYRGTLAFVSIPRPLRSLAWRAVMSNPRWFKRFRRHCRNELDRHVWSGRRLGHSDCTSHADDHRRWHCDETSVPERPARPTGAARSHHLR
jgi:hypothetical protein